MRVFGIDFTSRPSRRKPITCLQGVFERNVLRAHAIEEWTDFTAFERALVRDGPWIAGFDFPFGQSRRFIETIGWPSSWDAYVGLADRLGREAYRETLTRYRDTRAPGDKEHRRAVDKAAGSISPQKLYGVPVGLMFFEGVPRLLRSGATIPFMKDGDPDRIAVEAYPGVLARQLIGRRSYKNDARAKQTPALAEARAELRGRLVDTCRSHYGFGLVVEVDLGDDPGADRLDALLCAVQAAWAWSRRDHGYGAPEGFDRLEGWIADPAVRL